MKCFEGLIKAITKELDVGKREKARMISNLGLQMGKSSEWSHDINSRMMRPEQEGEQYVCSNSPGSSRLPVVSSVPV